MKKFIKNLFKRKCKHEWNIAMFQKLTDDNSLTHYCSKCGSYEQIYRRDNR